MTIRTGRRRRTVIVGVCCPNSRTRELGFILLAVLDSINTTEMHAAQTASSSTASRAAHRQHAAGRRRWVVNVIVRGGVGVVVVTIIVITEE